MDCDPVSIYVKKAITEELKQYLSHPTEEDLKPFGLNDLNPQNVHLVDVDKAVTAIGSPGFLHKLSTEIYDMVDKSPQLEFSDDFTGTKDQIIAKIDQHLQQVLSKKSIENCLLKFNTGQITSHARRADNITGRSLDCQLSENSHCLINCDRVSVIYRYVHNSASGLKAKDNNMTWLWVLLALVVIGLLIWWFVSNRKNKTV